MFIEFCWDGPIMRRAMDVSRYLPQASICLMSRVHLRHADAKQQAEKQILYIATKAHASHCLIAYRFGGASFCLVGSGLAGDVCAGDDAPAPPGSCGCGGPTFSVRGTNTLFLSSPRPITKSPTFMSGSVMLSRDLRKEVLSSTSISWFVHPFAQWSAWSH